MTALTQFIVAFSAAVCATAAVGVYGTTREILNQIRENAKKARQAQHRSVGNRRHQKRLSRLLLPKEKYRPPSEFDPKPQGKDE